MIISKLPQSSAKYLIRATLTAEGVVKKPDVIGAIFGQTEGLLGLDMDLRELQRTGRIGRIEVNVENNGSSKATITIPSSLDATETSLIAASLETIEKVGPCSAKVKVEGVNDKRFVKRKYILKRGKELLKNLLDSTPETKNILTDMKESVRGEEICEYKGLACGPDISGEKIILLEGRADVLNLLKHGIKNVLSVEGTTIPKEVMKHCKGKEVTAFLDGDRAGKLLLKKMMSKMDLDFVARAPEGKEVEELSKEQIFKCLRDTLPITEFESPPINNTTKKLYSSVIKKIGKGMGIFLDDDGKVLKKKKIEKLDEFPSAKTLIMDGKVDRKIVSKAKKAGIKDLVGKDKENFVVPAGMRVYVRKDL